ncbi:MAG: RIP metalloprotease RseP [Blautia sp.]|nr:RIP metalloprotease RseP [Lachnoclostridium sp.]MCM1210960.1 RIP metalloprotease RseP [Blautia sp.]
MITTVILFIIIFGIVVISHEFGHFLIGKRNGIRVLEFAVGMGPTLFSFQKGETKYSLKILPIGGACMFDGEDGMATENGDTDEHTFLAAGVWARIGTIFAGPFFNFLLAFVFSLILVAFNGADRPVIQKITADSAAEEAGILAGDEILRMNNERIRLYREVSLISALNQGESMTLQLKRGDEVLDVTLTPRYSETDGRYYIGLSGAGELIQCNPAQVFQYGVYEVRYWVKATYKSLLIMLRGQAKKEDVSGPIGIAQFVGDAYEEVKPYGISSVIFTMMNIVVLLSVNLGILNLLPLPALDGGRLVFLFLEVLRGKPISPEKEGIVHFAGLVVFMILMVFVMYNDIMKLIH